MRVARRAPLAASGSGNPGGTVPAAPAALVGHVEARRSLTAVQRAERWPPALLISGEEGIGKARFATWAVQSLWCVAPTPGGEPCLTCSPCRKVDSGQHPDLHVVRRDPEDELGSRHEITVGQVRDRVLKALAIRPVEAPARVVVLVDADELNEEAQNALLKVLEEPPGGGRLLLTSARPDALLDTVRSRCQTLRLAPLDEREMEAFSSWAEPAQRRLSRGRPGLLRALDGLDLPRLWRAFDATLTGRAPGAVLAAEVAALVDAGEEGDIITRQRLVIDLMRTRLRDLVAWRSGAPPERLLTPPPEGAEGWPAAEALLAGEEALLAAGEDLRRHLPGAAVWTALGLALTSLRVHP